MKNKGAFGSIEETNSTRPPCVTGTDRRSSVDGHALSSPVVFVKILAPDTLAPITLAPQLKMVDAYSPNFSLDGLGLDLSAVGRYDLGPRSGARRRAPSLSPSRANRASRVFSVPAGNLDPLCRCAPVARLR